MAFLDFLASGEIKDAFVEGRIAFVLDSTGRDLLWLNGPAAMFFGFSSLADALDREAFFDRAVCRQIDNGLKSGRPVMLRGRNQSATFVLSNVSLPGVGRAVLAKSSTMADGDVAADLLFGLESADISAAIVDAKGNIVAATQNYHPLDDILPILLPSIDDGLPVKTVIKNDGKPLQLSMIRLLEDEPRYLVMLIDLAELTNSDVDSITTVDTAASYHFSWKMDKNGRFSDLSSIFFQKTGVVAAEVVGRDLKDLSMVLSPDDVAALGQRIQLAMPWTDLKIGASHVNETGKQFTLTLSGMPIFDARGELQGFRGHGSINQSENAPVAMPDRESDEPEVKGGLSQSERSAFKEIAERLRSELHLPEVPQNVKVDNKPAVVEAPSVLDDPTKTDYHLAPAAISNLLDTATDGVVWLDKQGHIRSLSAAASALSGFDREELVLQPFSTLFSIATKNIIDNYVQVLLAAGPEQLFNRGKDAEIVTKDGAVVKMLVTLVPLSSGQGFAALLRDMTNVKVQNQPQLDQAALAETIHEIRTPLNAMIGFADIMKEERFGRIENERYRGYVRDIVSSGKHILTLVNRFLEKAKTRHARDTQESMIDSDKSFDVVAQLRKSVALLENQANENGIIVRIVTPPSVPAIVLDEQEFRQIVWNLLSNAIRFTPSGGQIVVHAAYSGGQFVKISVSDNGIGMTQEDVAKAMQPYGQIARKDGRQGDGVFVGTGLGLPMTKTLVEKTGGRFEILSKPNMGTTIEMSFPVQPDI